MLLTRTKEETASEQVEMSMDDKSPQLEADLGRVRTVDEPVAHLHAKTFLVVFAVLTIYFAQLFNIVGAGALARDISGIVGGSSQTSWLTTNIAIMTAVLGPPVCQAADYWGRRWFLLILSAFGIVGCLIISRADSFGTVIAGEAIVGISTGAQPLIHAIPSEVLPRKYRPYAQASLNVAAALGALVGLLVGGALTRHDHAIGFRTYWYIAAAIYAAAVVIVFFLYNPPRRELQNLPFSEKMKRLDWIGYVLLALGLTLFSVGLSYGENPYSYRSAIVLGPFLVGCAFLIALIVYEWKFKADGMFHHGLFSRGPNFAIALTCVAIEGLIFFAANDYYAFEVSTFYEPDPLLVGVRYSIAFITYALTTTAAGAYCSRTKKIRFPTVIGLGAFVVYNICMATLNTTTNQPTWGYAVLVGFGLGICLCALVTCAQLSTPPELISLASGLMIGMRSIGGVIGLAVYNAVFNAKLTTYLGKDIAAAVLPLGLPVSSLPALIGDLAGNITPTPKTVPGVTPEIIAAGVGGLLDAFVQAFRYVWVTAGALSLAVAILACFLKNPKNEFTIHIDAPAEKDEDIYDAEAINANKVHHL